ncbi:MAG: orotidine-5'-phosphate decarboxylase [Patescibacteria group bacterium]
MNRPTFLELLERQWSRGNSVCVGLDSEYGKIPKFSDVVRSVADTIVAFNREIVDATKDLVCAYKPNIAFYEAYGEEGLLALRRTILDIRSLAPDVPVILDAKRADIGNTNEGYVKLAFDLLQADAITVHPYLGAEALKPFLESKDKGVIVLCRTSNPGAGEFQDRPVYLTEDECQQLFYNESTGECTRDIPNDPITMPLYQYVAHRVANHWNKNGNCALVVGATYPEELQKVREIVGDMPILIPGVGFQQKDVPLEKQVEQVVAAGKDSRGQGMIVNSSRGIIFASKGADFAEAARRETEKLRDLINQYR